MAGGHTEGGTACRRHTPEEIAGPLRQVALPKGQGKPVAEAIGVPEPPYSRRRFEHGGLKLEQVRPLKLLEQKNGRLRRAVSNLTPEKPILKAPAEPWPKVAQVGWRRPEPGRVVHDRRRASGRRRSPGRLIDL